MMLAGEARWIGSTIGLYSVTARPDETTPTEERGEAMRVGVGLPNTNPGLNGRLLVDWARKAEAGPFTSLGVLDRVAYDSIEPFVALAASAAATSRIGLVTMVVIGPLRSAALLAKQAASIDALSGGRLVLGLSIGARHDDYQAARIDHRSRGSVLTEQLVAIREHWEDHTFGPATSRSQGPVVLVGGSSGEAFARMARYGDGYVHGGGPPRAFAGAVARARAAWADAGRPGRPQLWGQGYFALGEAAAAPGAAYLRDYYAFTGPFAEKIAAANLITPQAVVDFVRGYEEAGCDELVLFPTVPDLEQLDLLAEVLA
jgi:alkanesulfonate monooxygenase SsuD/methylene tetrahydromethanopterin reductase-like flavin-dependent oxidoreductase (luciferase family)